MFTGFGFFSTFQFKGSIELTPNTKCNIAKRRTYSFPFYVTTARGTHLFKVMKQDKH